MLLISGILLIFIFGYLLSVILVPQMHILERLGNTFLLGFGVFTLFMFCYSTLGVKITLQSTLVSIGVCNLSVFVTFKLLKRKISLDFAGLWHSFQKMPRYEKILVLLILSFFSGSLILSTYYPVYIWDALALYDFRAKIIVQFGFYTQIAKNYFWFGGYPLFTSLSHTLVYLFGGDNPQFLYSLMYISFTFVFYGALRQLSSRRIAMISTLILITTPVFFDHSTFAYTNLPYSIFLSMGTIYLFVWFAKNKGIGYLLLSAVMTGLSTWTRNVEPFWMVNIVILILISIYRFKKYFLSSMFYMFVFLLIREPWNIVNRYFLSANVSSGASNIVSETTSYISVFIKPFELYRITEVGVYIYKYVIASWYPLLFLFIFCLLAHVKVAFNNINSLFILIIFLYFGLLVYGTYLFTFGPTAWSEIPDSARRMAMFFMPLMIFYIGITLNNILFKKYIKDK